MPTAARTTPRSSFAATDRLSPGDRRVLNENELAQRWGISPKTLQRWRSEGRGPKYLKLSKRVTYPLDAILVFEEGALLRIPRQGGHRFHGKLDSDSTPSWTPVPGQAGHLK